MHIADGMKLLQKVEELDSDLASGLGWEFCTVEGMNLIQRFSLFCHNKPRPILVQTTLQYFREILKAFLF